MTMKKYLYPKGHYQDGGTPPSLSFNGSVFNSGDVCDFSAEEFERLSNYFVFEDVSDNENETPAVNVEVEHATEKPVEASASADNLPVDQGIPVTDEQKSDTPNKPAKR